MSSRRVPTAIYQDLVDDHYSNDNLYSESLFKTLKYSIQYPSQPFVSLTAAREWVAGFVQWYNHEHRHSGIQFVTPEPRQHWRSGQEKTPTENGWGFKLWWSRGESNPRPQALHRQFYILSLVV